MLNVEDFFFLASISSIILCCSSRILLTFSISFFSKTELFYSRSQHWISWKQRIFCSENMVDTFDKMWFLISLAIDVIKIIIIAKYLGRLIMYCSESIFLIKRALTYQITRIKFYFLALLFETLSKFFLLKFKLFKPSLMVLS